MITEAPDVEVLWCEGCPSTERALSDLSAALGELGLDPAAVRLVKITSDQQAVSRGFVGSPTILIDGRDVAPSATDAAVGEPAAASAMSCRLYHLRDGRISPTPDPRDIRESLAQAVALRRTPR